MSHTLKITINPGGLTHTSVSLHDSLEIKTIFKIEVHLSNIYIERLSKKVSFSTSL